MPNHVHGILFITDKTQNAETQNIASLQQAQKNKFGPQSTNLASIIRGYKVGVKAFSTKNKIEFEWQSGFYEHIIKTENELYNIREYIINNPIKWDNEKNNVENLLM